MNKKTVLSGLLAATLLLLTPATALEQQGKHYGEQPSIEYWIVYKDVALFLPDGTPGYFLNSWMGFEVHVKNVGKRTYNNLEVVAKQEYLNTTSYSGDLQPGADATQKWLIPELRPGQEIILQGSHFITIDSQPGLDQTHLTILHAARENSNWKENNGRVFIDNPQAGIYCPPAA